MKTATKYTRAYIFNFQFLISNFHPSFIFPQVLSRILHPILFLRVDAHIRWNTGTVDAFARSNPAWEARLLNHPRYGATLRQWREKGVVSRTAKLAASGAFAMSIVLGFLMLAWPLSLIPLGVALVCGSWLWMRPEG